MRAQIVRFDQRQIVADRRRERPRLGEHSGLPRHRTSEGEAGPGGQGFCPARGQNEGYSLKARSGIQLQP